MSWYTVHSYRCELIKLKEFLISLAARNIEIGDFGLQVVLTRENLEEILPIFDEFSAKLSKVQKIAKFLDPMIEGAMIRLIEETKIENSILEIAIKIQLANARPARARIFQNPKIRTYLKVLSWGLYFFRKYEPENEAISIENAVVPLVRLISLLGELDEQLSELEYSDDEVFKPSAVNLNDLLIYIDAAITSIEKTDEIRNSEKERLVFYLKETKVELAEETPSWKKIVGALVIVATVLSGIAAVPEATKNVNEAIKHILGKSIERDLPQMLPLPPPKPQLPKRFDV